MIEQVKTCPLIENDADPIVDLYQSIFDAVGETFLESDRKRIARRILRAIVTGKIRHIAITY